MTLSPDLKQEAIRLRVEERFSLDDVQARTGISIGTLSVLLRPYPLREDELFAKRSASALRNNPLRKYNPEQSKFARMVEGQELSTKRKGDIAEAAVLFRLAYLGYEVARSVFEGSKADWLVTRYEITQHVRVQVKWARRSEWGRPVIYLLKGEPGKIRYISSKYCDVVVGYDLESDTAFVLPIDVCEGKRNKTCDEEYAEAWHLLGI